ncbi:hypothetical protein ACSTS3_10750 [Aquimarina muelleri]|uniref:hypothetical protein n=1 Tax=Aquimarina muelleri TaxID=279356 RepID=UPI003F686C07
MKNLIILSGMLLLILIFSSCEKKEIENEIYESELQLVDPDNDGAIDPGNDDEY